MSDVGTKEAKVPGPGPVIRMEPDIEIPGSKDPWVHRSAGMLCRTCLYFVPKELPKPLLASQPQLASPVGRCRRHAPTMSGYPVVFLSDWCGDHKLDENRA